MEQDSGSRTPKNYRSAVEQDSARFNERLRHIEIPRDENKNIPYYYYIHLICKSFVWPGIIA